MKTELEVVSTGDVLGRKFTIYGTIEDPLFLAKDIAEWIEHSNPRVMVQSVDEDEKIKLRNPVNNPYGGRSGRRDVVSY